MKGIWRTNPIGGPDFPPWQKFKDAGVTDFYVPALAKDPNTGKYVRNARQINPQYRKDILTRMGYRIYRDPSWTSITDPKVLAFTAENDIYSASEDHAYIPYMFDIEYHDPGFVAKTIQAFRTLLPKGPLAWTLEPWQGGWFTPALVEIINRDINLVVVPQNFYGNMTPAGLKNGLNVAQELVKVGVAPNRVKTFYDAAKPRPSGWDGALLSEETL